MEVTGRMILNQFKVLLLVVIITLIGQRIGYGISTLQAIPGMIIVIVICMAALTWASLIALVLTMPFVPTSKFMLGYTKHVSFLGTTTPILAFAGISIGTKVARIKELSWRLILIAFCVFLGTFFGSAVISHIVLKIQGII
jgi:hypothetical protein